MFVFIFPPAATGWHISNEVEHPSQQPAKELDGGWPHTAARASVAASSSAPGKQIGDEV